MHKQHRPKICGLPQPKIHTPQSQLQDSFRRVLLSSSQGMGCRGKFPLMRYKLPKSDIELPSDNFWGLFGGFPVVCIKKASDMHISSRPSSRSTRRLHAILGLSFLLHLPLLEPLSILLFLYSSLLPFGILYSGWFYSYIPFDNIYCVWDDRFGAVRTDHILRYHSL